MVMDIISDRSSVFKWLIDCTGSFMFDEISEAFVPIGALMYVDIRNL